MQRNQLHMKSLKQLLAITISLLGLISSAKASINLDEWESVNYIYDNNGNVTELLDGNTGEIVGRYEYDPYGNTTKIEGKAAQENKIRFSTKEYDETSGLYYYGYRHYDPVTGRWPSRDPIEEDGGINLYAFVGNDPIGKLDRLGLQALSFKVIKAADLGDCGELKEYIIQWLLSKKSAKGGWVVQELKVTFDVKDCKNKPIKHPTDNGKWHYWEAWDVNNGQKITKDAETIPDPNDDTYAIPSAGDCTKGSVTFTGKAAFYEDLILPLFDDTTFEATETDLDEGDVIFVPHNEGRTNAGILPATHRDPKLGNIGKTPTIDHNIKLEWDCCTKDKKTTSTP